MHPAARGSICQTEEHSAEWKESALKGASTGCRDNSGHLPPLGGERGRLDGSWNAGGEAGADVEGVTKEASTLLLLKLLLLPRFPQISCSMRQIPNFVDRYFSQTPVFKMLFDLHWYNSSLMF